MGRLLTSKEWALGAAILVFALIGLLPLCVLLADSFVSAGLIGWGNYAQTLGTARTWKLFGNSLLLAGSATLAATLIGVPLALLAAKSTLPLKGWLVALFCLPLLFPPYVLANGWFQILGRQGLLSQWFGESIGVTTSDWLFGLSGGVLVLSTAYLPVVLLLTIAALDGVNPSLEDAARLCAAWPSVLGNITLRLAAPGIALAILLSFLLALGEFAAPSFLRLAVFPVESFVQFSAFYNPGAAAAAASPLAAIGLLGLAVVRKWIGPGDFHFRWTRSEGGLVSFGRFDPWLCGGILAMAFTLVGLPCGALVFKGLSASAIALAWTRAGDSLFWTLLYAALAASAITTLGFLLGYAAQRKSIPGATLSGSLALMLFGLPGTLIGIAVMTTWNRPALAWLYGTPALLVCAFVMQYIAVGERAAAASIAQLSPSLEEAAQIAGAGWFRRVLSILVPLLRRPLLAVWLLVFILCMRDTSLPLLLSPPGQDTLTARTLTLMANGSQEMVAALCLFSMALAAVPASAALLLLRRGRHS